MGLFEGESLPRIARQIDLADVNAQNNDIWKELSIKEIRKSILALKKRLRLVWGRMEITLSID